MADTELVKRLLVEIDGNVEKLRRELRKGETEVKRFASETKRTGATSAAASDMVASKQANAARAIASATETIARQGKVSGEAAKQIIAQGANAAMFWGAKGAVVGAVGIGTLAIIGMFTRVKREAAEAAKVTRDEFAKMSSMDMMSAARRLGELNAGDLLLREDLGSSDPARRAEAVKRFKDDRTRAGVQGLEEERARLDAQRLALARTGTAPTSDARRAKSQLQKELNAEIEAIDKLLKEMEVRAGEAERVFRRRAVETGEVAKNAFGIDPSSVKERAAAVDKLGDAVKSLGERLDELTRDTLGTATEKIAAPFDELIRAARESIAKAKEILSDPNALGDQKAHAKQLIDQLDAMVQRTGQLRDVAVQSAAALAPIESLIQRIELKMSAGERVSGVDYDALHDFIEATKKRLAAAKEETDEYARQYAILKALQELQKKALGNEPKDPKSPEKKPLDPQDAADYARQLQQAADGALQLAQNLGGADANAIGLLRSIGQIAGNLPALSKALKTGDTVGALSAGLAIAGALSSLFGPSPEDKQRREELRANTEAIRELTKRAGHLGLNVTGSAAAGAAGGLAEFLGGTEAARLRGGLPGDARREAKRFGLDLAELDAIAKEHGITLNGSIDSFLQLQKAIGQTITKLGEFGTDVDAQRALAEAEIAIRGITDPAEQAAIRRRATAGRSSALDSVTAGLDLSTSEGRAQARKNAEALLDVMRPGGATLGPGDLGSLTGDQFLQALLDLIAGLEAVEGGLGAAASGSNSGTVTGFRDLTEATGSRLEDRFRSLDVKASAAQETRLAMLATLRQLAGTALPVPSLPAGFGAGSSGGARGGMTVVIESIVVNIPMTVLGGADPVAAQEAITQGLAAGVDEAIYRSTLTAARVRGNLRITQ
ncbi:MAG: hypothetical protein ACYC0B_02105 [Gemmatimonadaceae bacterium]